MKVYGVTESELRTLTLVNGGITALFSFGTGFIAYALDLHRDLLLAGAVPDNAKVLADVIQPLLFILGGALYVLGVVAFCWKGLLISSIKRESKNS